MYEEIYGDQVQALHILDCHNRAIITAHNRHVKEYETIVQSYAPVVFEGSVYTNFLSHCNDIFERFIKKCYTEFVMIGQPIITRHTIDKLVSRYNNDMNSHYETFLRCLVFIKKWERQGISFKNILSIMIDLCFITSFR